MPPAAAPPAEPVALFPHRRRPSGRRSRWLADPVGDMELAKPQVLQHGTWVLTLPLIGAAWVAFATWRGSLRSAVAAWALTFPLAVTAASLWLLPELDVVKSRKPVGDAVRTLVPTDAE